MTNWFHSASNPELQSDPGRTHNFYLVFFFFLLYIIIQVGWKREGRLLYCRLVGGGGGGIVVVIVVLAVVLGLMHRDRPNWGTCEPATADAHNEREYVNTVSTFHNRNTWMENNVDTVYIALNIFPSYRRVNYLQRTLKGKMRDNGEYAFLSG